jgi:hypothetical protein
MRSHWAKQELQLALHRQVSGEGGAVILPVILEDADVPPLLRQYQWLDLRDDNLENGVSKLVEAIHHWSTKRSAREIEYIAGPPLPLATLTPP